MSSLFTLSLAQLPVTAETDPSVTLPLNGLVGLFLVLGCIWFILEIIGKIVALRKPVIPVAEAKVATPSLPAASTPTATASPVPATANPSETAETISPHTVALIAAAVHLAVGTSHRIVSIAPILPDHHWAREGRRHIFASHSVR